MAPCSVTAVPSPSSPHSPDSAPDITPPPPSSETRNKVDRVPRARSCHKLRLASAHSLSKSVSGFLASAEPSTLLQSASLILRSLSRISQNQNAHFSRGCYGFSLRAVKGGQQERQG